MRSKIALISFLILITLGCQTPPSPDPEGKNKKLFLGVVILFEESASWLNENLEDGDWAGIWFGKYRLLKPLTNNKIVRNMNSSNYQRLIDSIQYLKANRVDIIMYDIEQGSKNISKDELGNPVRYTKLLREFSLENGFKLGVAPSRMIIKKHGAELAKHVDYFLFMTGAAQEKDAEGFRKVMKERIDIVKSGKPDVKVIVQLRTFHQLKQKRTGPFSAHQLLNLARAIQDYADGIVILPSKETFNVAKDFILLFNKEYRSRK